MRSSFFVILSVFVHGLCVAAIALHPSQVAAPEGAEVEVQIGEAAELPGVEQPTQEAVQSVAPPVELAKAADRKTRVVTAPMEKVSERKTPKKAFKAAKVAVAPVANQDESLDPEISDAGSNEEISTPPAASTEPELVPVKDTVPAGVESDDQETEGATEDAKGATPTAETELAKGGATKDGAVSYLDLKQAQGNHSPMYPLQARKENRQGLVELLYRVTKEGKVADVQIAKSSGHKDLDQEAARAVAQFRFVPGQEGWARHPVAFSLKGQASALPSRLRSAKAE